MTGLEIIGVVFAVSMIAGLISGASSDTATKTKACLVCVENETSRETDIDTVTEPHLDEETRDKTDTDT